MKKRISILFCLLLLGSVLSLPQSTAYAQDDITGITLETEMRAMIEQGVINGFGEGIYKPGENVTRGQFATFISRALKLPDGEPVFTDVPLSSDLAKGINSASSVGIVQGYTKTTFGPNDPVTREQIAAMVDRALVYLNVQRTDAPLNFTDAVQINETFKLAVARNASDEIIKGIPNGDGTFRFLPQKTATRAEAAAFIYRMLIKIEDSELPPVVDPPQEEGFKIATISNGELVYGTKTYADFDAANNAITNQANQVVTLNEQIVSMGSGLVFSKPSVGQAITYIYSDSALKNNTTYITANQEMKYLDSTETYVKVLVAGMTAYVKHSEVSLVPLQLIEGRSYYTVNSSGDLVHYIYNPVTKTYASYSMGVAPDFLAAGETYYSWDGGVFYNTTGNQIGTAYQYFNYLPARTETIYTAAELNSFIDSRLAELEGYYQSNPAVYGRYKDATKLSKIKGLGAYLKEAESKYNVNALFILGIAIHESDNGMSKYALDRNNLFGLKAYDSNEDAAERFASPNDAIDALITRYLNKNYINPAGLYANGGATGNKARGFNVKYASDPYWGQKIAGQMYRIDKFLGKKDFGRYTIGETTTAGLNIRNSAEVTSTNLQFTYKKAGMPVAILDSSTRSDGSIWYKIYSDSNDYEYGYVYSLYVKEMQIAQ